MRARSQSILVALSALALLGGCSTTPTAPPRTLDAKDIVGSWTLTDIGSHRVTRAINLRFASDGSLNGEVRCNGLSGRYHVIPPRILFSGTIVTVAGCSRDWPANRRLVERGEQTLFGSPSPIAYVSVDGQRLYVRGRDLLQFVRLSS